MTDTRVVIVAADDDYAADKVVRHLNRGRTTFTRLDPGRMRASTHIRAAVGEDPNHDSWLIGEPVGPETAVFWRKPTPGRELQGDAAWAAYEATEMVHGALRACGATRWLNDPHAAARASPKIPQLTVARGLGLLIPETLVTTDAEEAAQFIAAGPTVVKPFTQRYTDFCPVWEITASDSLDGLGPEPCAFQRRVTKTADLRVTVVGEEVFACRVLSGELDWRVITDRAEFVPIRLDPDVAKVLPLYLAEMGLAYGAFDFAEDADGVPWFLECNPMGEFGFQEDSTGAPITRAMADWLLSK
ncbi:hypothetical protein [Kitasatospora sp. McL0602]|uniref:hypothetical protein n=1 Tax=Kitasatospora sp. McL0602 TaxID=3439530 RepID=UPI003F88E394